MLILASASPRRSQLLTEAGFTYQTKPAQINEDPNPNEPPAAYVERLAREKAEAVYTQSTDIVLGADTTVTIDGEILGKPQDAAEAARMLRKLSGRTHQVITGVAVVTASGTQSFTEITEVTMHPISDQQIAAYVGTGQPPDSNEYMDKAGAYAIQGAAAKFIAKVNGLPLTQAHDYTNVIGLPIARTAALLHDLINKKS